jgi:transcriptional regulator with XRE-family HTH domain
MDDNASLTITDDTSQGIDFVALGDRLRAYRIAAGLRSEDVAGQLDISRAAVYRLERGEIVKIATLERLARLLGVTMANLLGIDVEYHSSALSYFERMRQLEARAVRVLAHFDPISYLLTSPDYDRYLRLMLEESLPVSLADSGWHASIDTILGILQERKRAFSHRHPWHHQPDRPAPGRAVPAPWAGRAARPAARRPARPENGGSHRDPAHRRADAIRPDGHPDRHRQRQHAERDVPDLRKALWGSALGYAMDGFDLLILGFMLRRFRRTCI